jgi:hypothetical protein
MAWLAADTKPRLRRARALDVLDVPRALNVLIVARLCAAYNPEKDVFRDACRRVSSIGTRDPCPRDARVSIWCRRPLVAGGAQGRRRAMAARRWSSCPAALMEDDAPPRPPASHAQGQRTIPREQFWSWWKQGVVVLLEIVSPEHI